MRVLIVVGCAAGLAGAVMVAACTTTQPITITEPWDAAEAAYALQAGPGRIEGQAFMRQRGGGVVTAAGEPVMLMPAVRYTEKAVAKWAVSRSQGAFAPQLDFATLDPQLRAHSKFTTADATGNFIFEGLSPGEYYIVTQVRWEVASQYGPNSQGDELLQKVTVGGDGPTRVIISG